MMEKPVIFVLKSSINSCTCCEGIKGIVSPLGLNNNAYWWKINLSGKPVPLCPKELHEWFNSENIIIKLKRHIRLSTRT